VGSAEKNNFGESRLAYYPNTTLTSTLQNNVYPVREISTGRLLLDDDEKWQAGRGGNEKRRAEARISDYYPQVAF
jgi:hypothetical protein